jgi:hypothetical protein
MIFPIGSVRATTLLLLGVEPSAITVSAISASIPRCSAG